MKLLISLRGDELKVYFKIIFFFINILLNNYYQNLKINLNIIEI